MKRTRSKDEKVSPDEKSRNYGELVTVMKESASHFVHGSADRRDLERDSFFTWLNDFTSKLPRHSWRTFQMKTVALAMEITPAESPQPNTARSRIEPAAEAAAAAAAAAASSHLSASKSNRSSRYNIHRPNAGTAVAAVPGRSEHT